MTAEHWRQLVVNAVQFAENGNPRVLDRLAELLAEGDQVREKLQQAGVAWTDRPLSESIEELVR